MGETFLDAVRSRVVIYDGATGTWLQEQDLTADDFGGPEFEGCNEILGVTRPDVIERFHRTYCEIGVDAIETNTFGSFSIPLAEYGIADRDIEITLANARIARKVADEYGVWVAGSIGPGTKFASLGQITYDDLRREHPAGVLDPREAPSFVALNVALSTWW